MVIGARRRRRLISLGIADMRRTFTIANAVLAAINLLVWGSFIWLGIDLVRGVTAQHAPGYPNHGQITYYIRFPILMAVPMSQEKVFAIGFACGLLLGLLIGLIFWELT